MKYNPVRLRGQAGATDRFRDLNSYLREAFGCRVQKITVDAGLSCPNRDGTVARGGCLYCNRRGSGTGAHELGLTISEQLRRGISRAARRYKACKFIAYFQSFSNTYAPVADLKGLYEEALAVEDIVGLAIGTRPDCVAPPVLDLLQGYTGTHMIWVEYGLQSANDATLRLINRGHDVACFTRAVRATQGRGIKICAHVILGLPGEKRSDVIATADYLNRLGIDGVKLHLLYVVKGTGLERLYRSGAFRCLQPQEYADLVCDVIERLPAACVIQRLTSDPHQQELVAPAWALEKAGTRRLIMERLEARDSWQGKSAAGLTGSQEEIF